MIFFRLDRPAQLALIGAALVAPGCYGSHGDVADGDTAADDARDTSGESDGAVDTLPDSSDVSDEGIDPDMVVDCVPPPNCGDVTTGSLTVRAVEPAADYGVGEVVLSVPAVPPWADLYCSTYPCVTITPAGGVGTVSDVVAVDRTTYRFRYTNPGMTWDTPVRLDVSWRVYCEDPGGWREETVTGSAWACRDASFRIAITGTAEECPSVVDDVPPPMVRAQPPGSRGQDGLRLRTSPAAGGELRLRAEVPAGTRSLRWLASGGTLRMLADDEALFRPGPAGGVAMVQVAAFTPGGVSIQVFRRKTTGG
ncbi:MAG: hypothetical protein HY905_03355 [Deltaproteobacteria bacterium]|nr:hypothetical protein [Deltaproteobacteria bacterium]